MEETKKNNNYATGRRKTSSARVYLKEGKGNITVNKKPLEKYFGRLSASNIIRKPLILTDLNNKFDFIVTVKGGGDTGQIEAIRHGISRVLVSYDENNKDVLKKANFLTRDSRKVERKKVGLHKARKKPQFSKR